MVEVEMVHSNFFKVIEDGEIIGCITSTPCLENVFVYIMNKEFHILNCFKLSKDFVCSHDIAEYERLLAEYWGN